MTTIADKLPTARISLFRSIVLGGVFIFVAQLVIQSWLVATVIQNNPFTVVLQYIASGATGSSAFEGGMSTALLGVFFHLIISFVVASVFILTAARIPRVRHNPIAFGLLYGIGVWVIMHHIVLPLSVAPAIPPPSVPFLIEEILEHCLLIGLPLGLLVQRNANAN